MSSWFNSKDIKIKKPLFVLDDLHGYVLPHAGTSYSGHILSHTLRFKPKKFFNTIVILYYPARPKENIVDTNPHTYHEEYVVKQTILYVIKEYWKINRTIIVNSFNVRDNPLSISNINLNKTLIILSADFSHFLEMQTAISLENCAAKRILFNDLSINPCSEVIDNKKTFQILYQLLPNIVFQWIGRTRSVTTNGVGYLSFLIRNHYKPRNKKIDGMFVSVYDVNMNNRECLGQWFNTQMKWSENSEQRFIKDTIQKAKTTSRLTSGTHLDVPVSNYTITYLTKTKRKEFIRGYHGIKANNAFYLPQVFLENTYENGKWIESGDKVWKFKSKSKFNLRSTFTKLREKSMTGHNRTQKHKYDLYHTRVSHHSIPHSIPETTSF